MENVKIRFSGRNNAASDNMLLYNLLLYDYSGA